MPETTPQPRRVTPERIAVLVARYARLQGLTGRAKPAEDWTFTVEVVAGLKDPRSGGDAWALVVPHLEPGDAPGGSAHVRVRDIDATPIPGFDGDPMLEIRVTVSHELFHCVVAEATRGGALTIPAEERIVEAAAQAVVRSEGTGDARVMARSIAAIPSALRARISASAGLRARGGSMDGKQVLAAIAGQDEAAALKILNDWAAEQLAQAGHPGAVEPDGDEVAKAQPAPQPGGGEGGNVVTVPTDDARRAKGAEMDEKEMARARKALLDGEAEYARALALIRPAAKTQIVTGLRARLGAALTPAAEAEIMAAGDTASAEKLAAFAEKVLGGGDPSRARSNVDHAQNPGPERARAAMPTVEQLRAEGFGDSWLTGYTAALRTGPEVASAFLAQGRESTRARTAPAQNGGK